MTTEERIQLIKLAQGVVSLACLAIVVVHGADGGHTGGLDLEDLLGAGGLLGLVHWASAKLKG